jgi:hypothetical protein
MVLAIAAGEGQCSVATRLECDETNVWRACQRYRQGGLACLFADGRRGENGVSSFYGLFSQSAAWPFGKSQTQLGVDRKTN